MSFSPFNRFLSLLLNIAALATLAPSTINIASAAEMTQPAPSPNVIPIPGTDYVKLKPATGDYKFKTNVDPSTYRSRIDNFMRSYYYGVQNDQIGYPKLLDVFEGMLKQDGMISKQNFNGILEFYNERFAPLAAYIDGLDINTDYATDMKKDFAHRIFGIGENITLEKTGAGSTRFQRKVMKLLSWCKRETPYNP